MPVTFEDGDAAFYELTDFGGVATTLVADPDNAANTVASSNKPPGAELWGGTTVADASGFGALPFTATDTSMTVRVYSPDAGIPVRLKVEDRTDNTISVETEATTTVANAWETLTFDFSTPAAGTAALNLANTYDKASIFFNFGTDGNTAGDKTYLWEDLAFVTGSGGGGGSASTDFEGGSYTFNDFGGGVAAVVANPDASGINVSAQVAQMQKFAGELFGGSTLDLGGSVDLAAGDSYTMKVRAQRSVVVTFKLETGATRDHRNPFWQRYLGTIVLRLYRRSRDGHRHNHHFRQWHRWRCGELPRRLDIPVRRYRAAHRQLPGDGTEFRADNLRRSSGDLHADGLWWQYGSGHE